MCYLSACGCFADQKVFLVLAFRSVALQNRSFRYRQRPFRDGQRLLWYDDIGLLRQSVRLLRDAEVFFGQDAGQRILRHHRRRSLRRRVRSLGDGERLLRRRSFNDAVGSFRHRHRLLRVRQQVHLGFVCGPPDQVRVRSGGLAHWHQPGERIRFGWRDRSAYVLLVAVVMVRVLRVPLVGRRRWRVRRRRRRRWRHLELLSWKETHRMMMKYLHF